MDNLLKTKEKTPKRRANAPPEKSKTKTFLIGKESPKNKRLTIPYRDESGKRPDNKIPLVPLVNIADLLQIGLKAIAIQGALQVGAGEPLTAKRTPISERFMAGRERRSEPTELLSQYTWAQLLILEIVP